MLTQSGPNPQASSVFTDTGVSLEGHTRNEQWWQPPWAPGEEPQGWEENHPAAPFPLWTMSEDTVIHSNSLRPVPRSESTPGCQTRAGSRGHPVQPLATQGETEAPVLHIPSGCKIHYRGDAIIFHLCADEAVRQQQSPRKCVQEKRAIWGRVQVTGRAEEAIIKGPVWHPGQTGGGGNH